MGDTTALPPTWACVIPSRWFATQRWFAAWLASMLCTGELQADVIELSPSVAGDDCVEEFEQVANRLQPGDRLVLKGGQYIQSCRRALTLQGTKKRPIIIEAAPGERPVLTRPEHNRTTENNLELIDARYVIVRGIEFVGGSIGVRLLGQTHHLEFAYSTIRDTGNAAFTANTGDSTELYLHHNHILNTGVSRGETEGEGFYLGCHDRRCAVSTSRIEHNRIERLGGRGQGGNDGIEIKPGSGGNRVAYNLITGAALDTDFPCILAYGAAEVNLIENNLLTNCNVGLHVVSDAIVRGNVVQHSRSSGITVQRHRTIGAPQNVYVVNNSVTAATRSTGLSLWLWGARDIVVANNAISSPDGVAVKGIRLRNARFDTNWVEGALRGVPLGESGVRVSGGFAKARERTPPKAPWTPSRESSGSSHPNAAIPLDAVPDGILWHHDLLDSGTPVDQMMNSTDLTGQSRPQGSGIDIGAYERPSR